MASGGPCSTPDHQELRTRSNKLDVFNEKKLIEECEVAAAIQLVVVLTHLALTAAGSHCLAV